MLGIEPSPEPMDRKTFNKHFDNLLVTGQLNPDILEFCDKWQMNALNEVKKALIRLKKQQ
jgi:hypothetical protein